MELGGLSPQQSSSSSSSRVVEQYPRNIMRWHLRCHLNKPINLRTFLKNATGYYRGLHQMLLQFSFKLQPKFSCVHYYILIAYQDTFLSREDKEVYLYKNALPNFHCRFLCKNIYHNQSHKEQLRIGQYLHLPFFLRNFFAIKIRGGAQKKCDICHTRSRPPPP